MAMFMQYQVGSCWSSVEDNKLAGCLSYYADLKDAAKHAHEVGTGVQPMEVFVDLDHQPEGRLDYLGKPFQMGELIARVRGLTRRGAGRTSNVVAVGGLRLDTTRMSATFEGAPAHLSPLEFRLLDQLAHSPERAVSAGELAEHLYGAADAGDTNAIEAIVARLRRKFGAGIITTRRGFGYLLGDPP